MTSHADEATGLMKMADLLAMEASAEAGSRSVSYTDRAQVHATLALAEATAKLAKFAELIAVGRVGWWGESWTNSDGVDGFTAHLTVDES